MCIYYSIRVYIYILKSINRVLWLRSNLGVKSQSLSNLVLSDLKTLSLLMQQNSDRYFCVHEADQVAPTKTFGGL